MFQRGGELQQCCGNMKLHGQKHEGKIRNCTVEGIEPGLY